VSALTRKSFAAATKALDEAQGLVEAFVNTGNVVDAQSDRMVYGCWSDVLKAMKAGETDWPAICWSHASGQGGPLIVTGKVLGAEEVAPGDSRLPARIQKAGGSALKILAKYNLGTTVGRDAFSNVAGGYVKQWSVGFYTAQDGEYYKGGARHVTKVSAWLECSNVLAGASPYTATVGAKATSAMQREDSAMPLNDLIAGIVAEEMTNTSFRQDARAGRETRIEKGIDENPEILIAAARIRLSHLRPSDPQAVNLRQWIDSTERRLAQGKNAAAQAQRVQEIQTMFGLR